MHTGPLSDDGALNPALLGGAGALLTELRDAVPDIRVQAWLGDVVGAGRLDVGDAATRDRIVGAVAQVLHDGFDGAHLDLEPVADGDRGYLALLTAAHSVTEREHAVLSVAADQLEPVAGARIPAQWVTGRPHFWSTGFLHDVAADVDQVVIMAYDSGVPLTAGYSGYVRADPAGDGRDAVVGGPADRGARVPHGRTRSHLGRDGGRVGTGRAAGLGATAGGRRAVRRLLRDARRLVGLLQRLGHAGAA